MTRIGIISDTHGLLRPEVLTFLRGSQLIVHGGDIGCIDIIEQLSELAPVTAVRGNNDRDACFNSIANAELLFVDGAGIYVVHDFADMDLDPAASGVRVVITGHSHVPAIRESADVLYINPGSAGPRRFKLPISVGEVIINGSQVSARHVTLG